MFALIYSTMAVTLLPTLTLANNRSGGRLGGRSFDNIYNKIFMYSLIATVPIIAFFGVFSAPVVYLLVSHSYGTAPLYLTLMALGIIINLAGTYITSLFIAKGKTRQLILYSLVSTIAQVIAVIALVPGYGALGAVIAIFLIGGIVDSALFMRGSRTVLKVRTDYGKLGYRLRDQHHRRCAYVLVRVLQGSAIQLALRGSRLAAGLSSLARLFQGH